MNPLVALMVAQPGMAARLQLLHADDGTGHCRDCSGGAQSGNVVWPCTIYAYATDAVEVEVEVEVERPR